MWQGNSGGIKHQRHLAKSPLHLPTKRGEKGGRIKKVEEKSEESVLKESKVLKSGKGKEPYHGEKAIDFV